MARRTNKPRDKSVEALTHEEATRKNIPTAEYQSVMQKEEQSPVRVAYERRNRDLDPQLVWRGKDEQDWSIWLSMRRRYTSRKRCTPRS